MTRRHLADESGLSYSTLSDLESGRSTQTFSLHRIAEVLGVSAAWLETGRGRPEAGVEGRLTHAERAALATELQGSRIASAYGRVRWRYETAGRVYELERDPEPLVLAYRFEGDPSEENRRALAEALESRLRSDAPIGEGA